MSELLTDNMSNEYILNDINGMLYKHVPFKKIAKKATELCKQYDDSIDITEGDIKKYANEHYFEEIKPTTVDDIKETSEVDKPMVKQVSTSKEVKKPKGNNAKHKKQTVKSIREKIENSRDAFEEFCKNPDKKLPYTITYFVTLAIVLVLYYISLKSGYSSLGVEVNYGIGNALPSLLYVTVLYTILFRYILPFIYSAITFVILIFIR
jgi:hypothetical protein